MSDGVEIRDIQAKYPGLIESRISARDKKRLSDLEEEEKTLRRGAWYLVE